MLEYCWTVADLDLKAYLLLYALTLYHVDENYLAEVCIPEKDAKIITQVRCNEEPTFTMFASRLTPV